MFIEEVRKLPPEEIFIYWCRERQEIYRRKEGGWSKPWTDDVILQNYYFTNVYREQDKTTVWFRDAVRFPMSEEPGVILATVIFRWFNLIETGQILLEENLFRDWREAYAVEILGAIRDGGGKVFTGAFMINSPPGEPKLEAICKRITNVWDARNSFPRTWPTLQNAHQSLLRFPGMGGFMAYEVVTDLRHTAVLRNATDVNVWCNPGPGAIRGMYRLLGRSLAGHSNSSSPAVPRDWREQTARLLVLMKEKLPEMDAQNPFEMHEVEMVLCEYDKFCRLLTGDGKSKRNYQGAR